MAKGVFMKLGEFKKMVNDLSDDTDILIGYHADVDDDDFFISPLEKVQIENKSNLFYDNDEISQTVVCVFGD